MCVCEREFYNVYAKKTFNAILRLTPRFRVNSISGFFFSSPEVYTLQS